ILVAAGLVISALRTAHEAGWLNAGQQPTVNLAWLVAPGTIQSALITGVLGIPADPRRVELAGWLAYLAPVALFLYWPLALRPRPRVAMRWQFAGAACLGLAAMAGFLLIPAPQAHLPTEAPIVASGPAPVAPGTVRLIAASADEPMRLRVAFNDAPDSSVPLPSTQRTHEPHAGIDASAWTLSRSDVPLHAPTTLTLDQLVALSGGRIPLGLNPHEHPGPFSATWSARQLLRAWIANDVL